MSDMSQNRTSNPDMPERSADESSGEMRGERVSGSPVPDHRGTTGQPESPPERTPGHTELPRRQAAIERDPRRKLAPWPELGDVEQRFHEIEAEFIEEPQAAVKKADMLIQEAVERMTRELQEEAERMHGDLERSSDTEQLRIAMLNYRTFIDSLGGRRVA
jgi:hypothetical protein